MNVNRLKRMIADGRFATVTFVKRSTGETRRMRCRTGVTKALRGGAPAYDPDEHGLVTVYDLDRRDYRSIPADSVVEVRAGGVVARARTPAED